jgi:hypothetical protein
MKEMSTGVLLTTVYRGTVLRAFFVVVLDHVVLYPIH